ncbi:hypothetical protein L1049_009258 [Liquidambar formosana]|uniref:Rho GTPase-activating protein 5-like n=1 Tax=Liquidambar formosana TaxID=63359 RepID=A0AAP0X519_LIQFO
MTQVLQSPSHFPSPPSPSSSIAIPCAIRTSNDASSHQHNRTHFAHTLFNSPNSASSQVGDELGTGGGGEEEERERKEGRDREGDQLSLLALLVTAFRKSLVGGCSSSVAERDRGQLCSAMEIGLPTNVRHVAHVTFDRFDGFLGLPVEFEPEVPRRPPSASTTVFGVSTESMQLSFDSRGNSVPTILLMMQRRLYAQGGLQAEGIFRITAGNSQEEYVRDQLNRGVIPDGIDVHCLAGLIKAWFRELPTGVLDSLSPEQVMQSQSEEECAQLVRLLPPTEAALLDWAINLMADVAQLEHLNKMNARNVAMVFAPNMTQMSDPLTALMYAVQVMNFLKTLIIKTLREREDSTADSAPASHLEPSDENEHHSSSQPFLEDANESNEEDQVFAAEEPASESPSHSTRDDSTIESGAQNFLTSIENIIPGGNESSVHNCHWAVPSRVNSLTKGLEDCGISGPDGGAEANNRKTRTGQSSSSNLKKGPKKVNERPVVRTTGPAEKSRGS